MQASGCRSGRPYTLNFRSTRSCQPELTAPTAARGVRSDPYSTSERLPRQREQRLKTLLCQTQDTSRSPMHVGHAKVASSIPNKLSRRQRHWFLSRGKLVRAEARGGEGSFLVKDQARAMRCVTFGAMGLFASFGQRVLYVLKLGQIHQFAIHFVWRWSFKSRSRKRHKSPNYA